MVAMFTTTTITTTITTTFSSLGSIRPRNSRLHEPAGNSWNSEADSSPASSLHRIVRARPTRQLRVHDEVINFVNLASQRF